MVAAEPLAQPAPVPSADVAPSSSAGAPCRKGAFYACLPRFRKRAQRDAPVNRKRAQRDAVTKTVQLLITSLLMVRGEHPESGKPAIAPASAEKPASCRLAFAQ